MPAGKPEFTCPSAPALPGVTVLGVVGRDGRVVYVSPPVPVDEAFLEALGPVDRERRFRFAGACVEAGCAQWTGTRCGVIDEVMAQVPAGDSSLPRCTIRKTCRWFAQAGPPACGVCPLVITDPGAG